MVLDDKTRKNDNDNHHHLIKRTTMISFLLFILSFLHSPQTVFSFQQNNYQYTTKHTISSPTAAITSPSLTINSLQFSRRNLFHSSNDFAFQHSQLLRQYPSTRSATSSNTAMFMASSSSPMVRSDLAVRFDQPILSPDQFTPASTTALIRAIITVLLSDIIKTAFIALSVVISISLLSKLYSSIFSSTTTTTSSSSQYRNKQRRSPQKSFRLPTTIWNRILLFYKLLRGKIHRMSDSVTTTYSNLNPMNNNNNNNRGVNSNTSNNPSNMNSNSNAIPMPFDTSDDTTQGWGVCTLKSKKRIGRSQYIQYDFDLPQKNWYLNLALGQQITLCCLDGDNNVVKGDFFLFSSAKNQKGSFSIVGRQSSEKVVSSTNKTRKRSSTSSKIKDDSSSQKSEASDQGTENDTVDISHILDTELSIGDEVALKPGQQTLDYKGQYLPVTDMVYFASDIGIVPVLEQVKTVLPSGLSSVKGVSVIWTNDNEQDFDLAISSLEKEYFKYTTKLAVSCIVNDSENKNLKMEDNVEIEEAVPSFQPGTMAVVSGPKSFAKMAYMYLVGKGYPKDCICVLK